MVGMVVAMAVARQVSKKRRIGRTDLGIKMPKALLRRLTRHAKRLARPVDDLVVSAVLEWMVKVEANQVPRNDTAYDDEY